VANRILILFAHPLFEKSRIHSAMLENVESIEHVKLHDLYEIYPDFNIDIEAEKQLLLDHDIIIWQHPLYWYNIPPLLKQWIDMVLQFGWAYGPGGDALSGKFIMNALSAGGQEHVYSSEGRNRYTIREFLAPLEQTARLCHLTYLPPFVVHGTHLLNKEQIAEYGSMYKELIRKLVDFKPDADQFKHFKYANQWLT
jgi:glutathione-regulated potassium-efflux system ancillary protein KefG